MEIELITLDITEDDQLDFQIALVDSPAIEVNWMAFSKDRKFFQIEDEEQRIVSGYFMVADLPIYRRDANGEYYVRFTRESIKNIAENFMRNGLTSNTNEMHQTNEFSEGVFVLESWLIDSKRGTKAPNGFESLEGSWFGSMKVENDEIWEKVKSGEFKGFSVEGNFIPTDNINSDERILEAIKKIIKGEVEITNKD